MLVVYSKKNCPACIQAKTLLSQNNISFTEVRIDEDLEARTFLMEAGHRTVPQIYKDGRLYVEGGYTGLQNLLKEYNVS